jgi:hypothetical protein
MATRTEKAFCVFEYARTQSIVTVQRRFRTKYEKFHRDECPCMVKRAGRPGPSEDRVECVRKPLQRSPRKGASIEHLRVCKINLKSFSFYRYLICYHPLRHSSVPIFL